MADTVDLSTRKSQLSAAKKALLAKRLQGALLEKSEQQRIPCRSRDDLLDNAPLSFAQKRLWFLHQLEPAATTYNLPHVIHLAGVLNRTALLHSFGEIIRRHESLRTRFTTVNGQPRQEIASEVQPNCCHVDLQALPDDIQALIVQQLSEKEVRQPFDLTVWSLYRLRLLQLSETRHVLLLTLHHIISDAWSTGVLVQELATLYETLVSGKPPTLPELPIQYADFAIWQHQVDQEAARSRQLTYWQEQLCGTLPVLELPTDYARTDHPQHLGAQRSCRLNKLLVASLKQLSQQVGATLFMTLLAAFKILLHRYTGQTDLIVGSPIANRQHAELEGLIGFFVNTLALRTDLSGNPSVRDVLRRVRQVALDAYTHQDLPFEVLVEALRPERSLSHHPIFQVLFALQNAPVSDLKLPQLTLESLKPETKTAQFDLSFELTEVEETLNLTVEYRTDRFAAATIARMLEHYQILLAGMVSNPDQQISALPLLTDREQVPLASMGGSPQANVYGSCCIHELIEVQVDRTPDAIAVVYADQQLTYQELNHRANQLAHRLQTLGIGPDTIVGLCVERSLELIIGLLAILKAGGAYLPLDPTYPQDRLTYMLTQAQVPVLLTQSRWAPNFAALNLSMIELDTQGTVSNRQEQGNLKTEITPAHLAYVIYTSGSTGHPKGVMVQHDSLVNYIQAFEAITDLKSSDRVLQFASLSFDVAAEEIFTSLVSGATLILRTEAMLRSIPRFLETCAALQLTVLDLPTAFWHQLTAELARSTCHLPDSLRLVIIGGEQARADQLAVWQQSGGQQIRLINAYGPTETTISATLADAGQINSGSEIAGLPIGQPVSNLQAYILDPEQQPVPWGVPGELYIGGAGVTRGYLQQPTLTAERFIPDLFSSLPGARLFRTGDRVRYRPQVGLEFLGRLDHQVKIRGFRVELSEVELALSQHSQVQTAVVLAYPDAQGNQQLVAYVSPLPEHLPTPQTLRQDLQDSLPSHLVPSTFVILPALPLTPSGKLDRQALPPPPTNALMLEESYVQPRTELEQQIACIWQRVLKISQVGIYDNFFDLGGHSLLMMQVQGQLHEHLHGALQAELSILDLFRYPTIQTLAMHLSQQDALSIDSSSGQQRTTQMSQGKTRQMQRRQQMRAQNPAEGATE
jgi:amino acid adenylation domain-containing protein